VGVYDGDSITALAAGNQQLKVRLDGIDAPELKQPYSTQAKAALSGLVFGKVVSLHITGKDRYKRTLAVVVAGGLNVNRELVRLGLAWRYEASFKDAALQAAQNEVGAARRGLWADPAPAAPCEWRRRS
jgi:micrococcal nuclease